MLTELKDIKECPHCGCKDVTEKTQKQKHTNGHWNEYLKFRCGYVAHFSPNYMSVIEESKCEESKAHKKIMEKRGKFIESLHEFVKSGDVDESFRERVNSNIQYLRP